MSESASDPLFVTRTFAWILYSFDRCVFQVTIKTHKRTQRKDDFYSLQKVSFIFHTWKMSGIMSNQPLYRVPGLVQSWWPTVPAWPFLYLHLLIHCPSALSEWIRIHMCMFKRGVLSGDLTAQFACTKPIMSSYPEPMFACYLNARLDPLSYLFNPNMKLVCLYKPINLFTNIKLSRRFGKGTWIHTLG